MLCISIGQADRVAHRRRSALPGTHPLDSCQHPLRIVQRRAAIERVCGKPAGARHIAVVKGLDCLVKNGFGLALPFGLGAACAFDIGTGAAVMAIEKQDSCPEINRLFVLTCEIEIESSQQQLLDPRIAFGAAQRFGRNRFGAKR